MKTRLARLACMLFCGLALAGCDAARHPPLALAGPVDLPRFMGDWYVIASIPTFIETDAHNAMESYRLAADGSIETTFTFREGSFDGAQKRYTPRGYVLDAKSNAVWGMQFLCPLRSDFRIAHLAADYSVTVIGRERRDYAWIMARAPRIAESEYQALLALLRAQGYDVSRVRRVPQRWG